MITNPRSSFIGIFSNKHLQLLTLFFFSLTSCILQRNVEYLQDENQSIKAFDEAEFPDYKLKPNDQLFIQVKSLDEGAANIFTTAGNQAFMGSGSFDPYLMSYSIDKDGRLLLPVIGNVLVRDKTTMEVAMMLKDSLLNILNQPIVSVKLVNRNVSVLGEVRSPGHFTYGQEKLSVYSAIGLAGDINDFGNRNNVVLLRNEKGQNIKINIDLTRSDLLTSDYYYLRPNDILYVKPRKVKYWSNRQSNVSFFFSTITTGLLIYSFIKQF